MGIPRRNRVESSSFRGRNDLKTIKEQYGDKLILRLAIFDKQMAMLNQTEEQVRADLRNWYSILAPGGRFLPEIVGIDDPYYVIQRQFHKEFEAEFFGQDHRENE